MVPERDASLRAASARQIGRAISNTGQGGKGWRSQALVVEIIVKDGGQTLEITEADSDDGGVWTCEAENPAGTNQLAIPLEVWSMVIFVGLW